MTQLITYAIAPSTVFAKDPQFDAKMATGEATFVGSGWQQAFEMYLELNERGYFNEDPLATPHELALELVGTGEAAMYVQVSAIIPDLEAIGGEGNFLLFPFPGADVAEEVWIPAAASAGWGVNAASDNVEAAKEFLRFLAQPENLTAYSTLRSEIPAVLAEGAEVPPELAPMVPFIEAGPVLPVHGSALAERGSAAGALRRRAAALCRRRHDRRGARVDGRGLPEGLTS